MDSPQKQNGLNLSSGLFECQKRVLPQMKLIPRMDTPPIFAAGGCQRLPEFARVCQSLPEFARVCVRLAEDRRGWRRWDFRL
jgi:hypothetical protein